MRTESSENRVASAARRKQGCARARRCCPLPRIPVPWSTRSGGRRQVSPGSLDDHANIPGTADRARFVDGNTDPRQRKLLEDQHRHAMRERLDELEFRSLDKSDDAL